MTRVRTVLCAGDQRASAAAAIDACPRSHTASTVTAALDDHHQAERVAQMRLRYRRAEVERRLRLLDEFGDRERHCPSVDLQRPSVKRAGPGSVSR
jgi:hypothetical protein